jgi:DNA helicase-2/ATP-dependent DNA helicase PcrA
LLSTDGARRLYHEHEQMIEALEAEHGGAEPEVVRRSLAATQAVRITEGEVSIDDVLHPLPQRPTTAQRLGTEVHAWIEELHRGLVGLAEEEALDEASLLPDRETVEALKTHFRELGFPDRRPFVLDSGEPATELPFTLKVNGTLVRGRIDAVYVTDDGTLEIVDFKTGEVPERSFGQLELYAEALRELKIAEGPVKLTFAYLRTGKEESETYTPVGLARYEAALAATTP